MIKYTRFFLTLLFAVSAFAAYSQSTATSSSPYSRYGLGITSPQLMPQNLGMGGIAVATNQIGLFSNINVINPASYGAIHLTTFDVGLYSSLSTLSQTGSASQKNSNFRLSHLAFAVPVSKKSALSFGLLPYSERGYNYKKSEGKLGGSSSPADTNVTNYTYSGDGGLSKAYLGYGFGIGKNLMIGGNVSYIFGNLKDIATTEIPALYGTLNSRIETSTSIGGLNYDYGAQYTINVSESQHIILGYSGSVGSKIGAQKSFIVSQYLNDADGNQQVAIDSVINKQDPKSKLTLPQMNRFGISFQSDGKFLIGADYSMGKWSNFAIGDDKPGLQDSRTLNVGGSFTPNINTIRNYLATVDYRLGAIYDETYMTVNNTKIKRIAGTIGLGLPLRPGNSSIYKINISAEVGRRGSLVNGLVRENYINLHLGFTLNDKWFTRYKFD